MILENKRLVEWLLMLVFFVVAPSITLYSVYSIALLFSHPQDKNIIAFGIDLPMFILSFYAGCSGSLLSYIYSRFYRNSKKDDLSTRVAKILFGGIIGVAAFLVVETAVFVKLFYPGIDVISKTNLAADYRMILLASVLSGLSGPGLVKRAQRRISSTE